MTQNMKETAARVNGLTAGGSSYFLKNDYIGDTMRLSEAMQSVNRLLGNLGTSDKASNFLLEQRSLLRAQSKENREIRELLNDNVILSDSVILLQIVDGLEYVRVKENIAETKARVQDVSLYLILPCSCLMKSSLVVKRKTPSRPNPNNKMAQATRNLTKALRRRKIQRKLSSIRN